MAEKTNLYSIDLSQARPSARLSDALLYTREAEILRGEETNRLIKAAFAAVKRLFTGSPKVEVEAATVTPHAHPDERKRAA